MDISKTAVEWAKAEAFSSSIFILCGLLFILVSVGFWQLGKTDIAKAFVIPTAAAGVLLLILGVGLFLPSWSSISSFPIAHTSDAGGFIEAEIGRADRVLGQYRTAIFMLFPLVIAACAILLIVLNGPHWRASFITVIAALVVVMLIDINANARLEDYRGKLLEARKQ